MSKGEESMTVVNTDQLIVDGGALHYEVAGQGDPLVLLHAGIAGAGMWDEQWAPLSQHYQLIRYDRPGFGNAPLVNDHFSDRRQLAQLLDHLGVERAHVLGCSIGGEIALDFALDYPQRVSALILVSATPSGFELQGEPPAGVLEMVAALQAGDLARAAQLQCQISVDGPFRTPEQVDGAARQRIYQMVVHALAQGGPRARESNPLQPPATAQLESITVPSLVITGNLDHSEIQRAAESMAAAMPKAQHVAIAETGHFPNLEKPEVFNHVLLTFLQAL
jgi:pimeloyl-ACP methyl ester carboxylesterase